MFQAAAYVGSIASTRRYASTASSQRAGSPSHSLARSNQVSACSTGGASGLTKPVRRVAVASAARPPESSPSTSWPLRGSNLTRSDSARSRLLEPGVLAA